MNAPRKSFDRLDVWLVATSLVATGVITLAHCSSSPVCGNGVQEGSEACDRGALNGVANSGCSSDCQIAALNVASVQIFVTRLQDESPGYEGASCSDLQAASEQVVLVGPTAADGFSKTWDCSTMNSQLIPNVTPGSYTVTVTLLDTSGAAITKPKTATATATIGQTANLDVNFAQVDFIKQDYTGTLYFTPSWGTDGTSCASASPVVTGYGVTLKDANGQVVSGMTSGNHALDGTESACYVGTGTAENVAGLPWGHYTLTFSGYAGSQLAYCKSFDVFNGPGTSSQPYDLTVTSANADAGSTCP